MRSKIRTPGVPRAASGKRPVTSDCSRQLSVLGAVPTQSCKPRQRHGREPHQRLALALPRLLGQQAAAPGGRALRQRRCPVLACQVTRCNVLSFMSQTHPYSYIHNSSPDYLASRTTQASMPISDRSGPRVTGQEVADKASAYAGTASLAAGARKIAQRSTMQHVHVHNL